MRLSLRGLGHSILRRFGDEGGIALITALIVMFTLTTVTTSVIYFTTESFHTSARQDADQEAYSLAEGGINTAIAKIYGAADPRVTTVLPDGTASHPATLIPRCPTTNSTETPSCYSTGTVSYKGSLDKTQGNTWIWTITSVGSVKVSNVSTVSRTLTRSLGVTGNNGTNGNSWTRFYQDATSPCLTLDGVNVPTNFATKGDICLINGATVTGTNTNIQAGGHIYVDPPITDNPSADNGGWTNSSRAYTNNSSYATASLGSGATSSSLDLSSFGYTLPSAATITGITVTIDRKAGNNTSTNNVVDATVQLLKNGTATGSSLAATSTKWPTSDGTVTYGGSTNLWGTTWTGAQVNTIGLRIAAKGTCSSCNITASIDYATITVYYSASTVGTSAAPIGLADVGSGCQLQSNTIHSPCSGTDKVYAATVSTDSAANNPNLEMPSIDWQYWYDNAAPGPKHFCTNASPGVSSTFFDNDSTLDESLSVNGEIAPAGKAYDCEVWQNGVLQGELKWDGSHNLYIYGTIFFDGNFRFDEDGEIVHYFGRGTMMSSHDDEIDALVCAGGTGNTYSTSCLANMASWSSSQNMMVLMSMCGKGLSNCNEYDQGGTTCTGSVPNCDQGHLPGGFQGILYSKGDCLIHQDFQDSGPVICNTITMPYETVSGVAANPTFYSFPSIGNLTDGMSYSDTASATDFTLNVSAQNGG